MLSAHYQFSWMTPISFGIFYVDSIAIKIYDKQVWEIIGYDAINRCKYDHYCLTSSLTCFTVNNYSSLIKASTGASLVLLVMNLATRVWNCWSWASRDSAQFPHIEQQYQRYGSTVPLRALQLRCVAKKFLCILYKKLCKRDLGVSGFIFSPFGMCTTFQVRKSQNKVFESRKKITMTPISSSQLTISNTE